jgi:hypothetical protein
VAGLLDDYYRSTARFNPQLGGRTDTRGRLDAIVNELGLPATLDQDGDWRFASDVGDFLMMVDPETGDVIVLQYLDTFGGRLKSHVDEMLGLLVLNFEEPGSARFSVIHQGGKDLVVISSRLRAADAVHDAVERMLADAMLLSRRLDLQLGREPAAAAQPVQNGAPPAAWYADPQGGGGQRWWDGAQWTAHTHP